MAMARPNATQPSWAEVLEPLCTVKYTDFL